MRYIIFYIPPFPSFLCAGKAVYRQGDLHGQRPLGINCFDLIIVESGKLYISVDGEEYVLKENTSLLIPEKIKHHGYRICPEKTVFHWLHFIAHAPTKIQTCLKRPHHPISQDYTNRLSISIPICQTLPNKNAIECMDAMQQLNSVTYNRFTKSATREKNTTNIFRQQELLMKVLKSISLFPKEDETNNITGFVMEYIDSHYMEDITLTNLSDIANCHPVHLIRCMKKQYGLTPLQIVNKRRLNQSAEFLQHTNDQITTIAYNLGFASPSYFCKQFKLEYGVTPNEYRKKRKESL